MSDTSDNLKWLKRIALLEGSSLIALVFVAVPLKYLLDYPLAVKVIGPVHGTLFVLYLLVLLGHFALKRISGQTTAVGAVASIIPFGTFIFKAKMLA